MSVSVKNGSGGFKRSAQHPERPPLAWTPFEQGELIMGHHRLTDRERNCIWRSWRKGLTFEAIGGKIGETGACVFLYLQRYGGIVPLRRKRRPNALTFRERKVIANGLAREFSIRESPAGYREVRLR